MEDIKGLAEDLIRETEKIIVGKHEQLELILTSVLCGGHVLLEDLPGSGKTTLVRTLALALGCKDRRIQFTPDLLPSDVVGVTVFNQKTGDFQTKLGPVDTNLLLADEINRAIPRTQAALLEAMEERQVTIDGVTYPLPEPFFVMATQNPVEKESTFPLPAAQMDRFFIKLSLGYPTREEEKTMLAGVGDMIHYEQVKAVASPERLMEARAAIRDVHLSDMVRDYIVEVVQKTREDKNLKTGASPRASRCLYQGGKALAAIRGRNYVTPDDIQALLVPVLSHRVTLSGEAKYSGKTTEGVIRELVASVPVPPLKENLF